MTIKDIYYFFRPIIPRQWQIFLRRIMVFIKRLNCKNIWPIDEGSSKVPAKFSGWPDKKKFALVLTHDIDTTRGMQNCYELVNLEKKLGFRSSFNFVPERYTVDHDFRTYLPTDGFEVGVHGLSHDGKLYSSLKTFQNRATKINNYIKHWSVVGFRSPSMHRNLDWLHSLNIEYDSSTFDTDPFEPQSEGVGTIFPFWVPNNSNSSGYVELPYTLVQDFTLFVLMNEKSAKIWKLKLDWIVEKGGMALLNTHPDYMYFGKGNKGIEEYPIDYYAEFLQYIKDRYEDQYWHVLPKEIAHFWKSNNL